MEQEEAPERQQYIDGISVWGNTAEGFEVGKKITQVLLKTGCVIKLHMGSGTTDAMWSKWIALIAQWASIVIQESWMWSSDSSKAIFFFYTLEYHWKRK